MGGVVRLIVLGVVASAAALVHGLIVPVQVGLKLNSPSDPATSVRGDEPRQGENDSAGVGPGQVDAGATPAGVVDTAIDAIAVDIDALPQELTLELAASVFPQAEQGLLAFIDARNAEEFEAGHIQGAYRIDQAAFAGGRTPEALDWLDPSLPVVVYCIGGSCDESKNVGIRLQGFGFERVHIMLAGYEDWAGAGLPVEVGPDPRFGEGS